MIPAILDKLDQVSTIIAQVRADLAANVQPPAPESPTPQPQVAAEPALPTATPPRKKPKRKPAPTKRRKSPK